MSAPLIAIVDDDPVLVEVFTEILEEEGYRVVACPNAEDAFRCIKDARADLVILDLWLGTPAGGWDVCAKLAGDCVTAATPIIICTAGTSPEPPADIQLPWMGLISKPFQITELLTTVKTALAAGVSSPYRRRQSGDSTGLAAGSAP
jgi:DNA-binding response OmpR family regulator